MLKTSRKDCETAASEAAVQVSGDLHMVVVPVPQGTDRYAYRQSFAETTGIKGAWLKGIKKKPGEPGFFVS